MLPGFDYQVTDDLQLRLVVSEDIVFTDTIFGTTGDTAALSDWGTYTSDASGET